METVKIKIVSNDGEKAIGVDQQSGNEVPFLRKDIGATPADFRQDLATGSILEAGRMELPERAARARYRQLTKAAKKSHRK
jgi:hypothetical protein